MKPKTRKAAGKASLHPLVLRRLSNAELLRQIGEIDGIGLRHVGEHSLAVSIEIGGRFIDVIRDSGSCISHHITRIGLGEALAQNVPGESALPGERKA
jgi:hypothetical protein